MILPGRNFGFITFIILMISMRLIQRWIEENPPVAGNGWESYPLSLRIVNWVKWGLQKRILDLCPLSVQDLRELLNAFYEICRWVPIYYLWRPNILDEGDNFVIELALAGNATHIVTNNIRDFQNAELLFPSLSIVRPEEFLGGY